MKLQVNAIAKLTNNSESELEYGSTFPVPAFSDLTFAKAFDYAFREFCWRLLGRNGEVKRLRKLSKHRQTFEYCIMKKIWNVDGSAVIGQELEVYVCDIRLKEVK